MTEPKGKCKMKTARDILHEFAVNFRVESRETRQEDITKTLLALREVVVPSVEKIVQVFSKTLDEMEMSELKSNPSWNYVGLAYKLAQAIRSELLHRLNGDNPVQTREG